MVGTVNVQHLESLADIVETITGVKVRERIPDRVIDDADEFELVDMSPQALELARVAHERNVTRIVIGHSQRSRGHELLHGSVVNKLLRALPDIDVNVVASGTDGPDDRRG